MSRKRRQWTEEEREAKRVERRARAEARITDRCEAICCECGGLGEHVKGDVIYPHREDLHRKNFFRCACGAYVGCHPFTRINLGRPAGHVTRKARNAAHDAFDALWQRKMAKEGCDQPTARNAAYAWLAGALGIEPGACHISWMTAPEARRVVEVCAPFQRRAA